MQSACIENSSADPKPQGLSMLKTMTNSPHPALGDKLKMAQANIARLEKSGSIPSTTTLQRIAKATGHKLVITFSRDT